MGRVLPWRGEKNPYRILISEVMLQQTQVSRVLQLYPRFLKRFPDFATLKRARTSAVIRAWKGMGYNNRAVRLQQLARTVMDQYGGRLPRTIEELQQLHGIGVYTAHALACLAFGQNVAVVDTNIKRVLGRLFPAQVEKSDIWTVAEHVLPNRNAHRWNQALMDLGATICVSANPKCGVCPVAKLCPSAFRIPRLKALPTKPEPSRNGVPNRIYRGRIVDALRHLPNRSFVSSSVLGRKVMESFTLQDRNWLEQLMKGLEKDGLVVLKKTQRGYSASLPQ